MEKPNDKNSAKKRIPLNIDKGSDIAKWTKSQRNTNASILWLIQNMINHSGKDIDLFDYLAQQKAILSISNSSSTSNNHILPQTRIRSTRSLLIEDSDTKNNLQANKNNSSKIEDDPKSIIKNIVETLIDSSDPNSIDLKYDAATNYVTLHMQLNN